MAQFVLGNGCGVDLVRREKERKEKENQEKARRHYKKDSRYLEDLYTLTYQEDSLEREDEDMDGGCSPPGWGLAPHHLPRAQTLNSLQVDGGRSRCNGLSRQISSGAMSLGGLATNGGSKMQFTSSTLDTNLHKILARRMAGGQGVSLRTCKLLTRAYYSLLREEAGSTPPVVLPLAKTTIIRRNEPKLDWKTLLQTDGQQLKNIVAGYTALVRGLNDELMVELMKKDELTAEQDQKLESISELTDNLL